MVFYYPPSNRYKCCLFNIFCYRKCYGGDSGNGDRSGNDNAAAAATNASAETAAAAVASSSSEALAICMPVRSQIIV